MFKKKPNIKPFAPLRSSDRRKIADQIIAEYQVDLPKTQEQEATQDDEAAGPLVVGILRNSLLPENSVSARFTTTAGADLKQVSGIVYAGAHQGEHQRILWFKVEDKIIPTIYTLWRFPGLVPLLHTVGFVVEKLRNGSPLMTPGLAGGPPFPKKATKNAVVAIASTENPSVPKVVGICEIDISSLSQVQGAKGHAVRSEHWEGDELWAWGSNGIPGGAPPLEIEGWISTGPETNISQELNSVTLEDKDEEEDDRGVSLNTRPEAQEHIRRHDEHMEGGNAHAAERIEKDFSTSDIDDIFWKAFLYAIHHSRETNKGEKNHGFSFPIPQTLFMSNMVFPYLPIETPKQAAALQIKKTSWKSSKKFIKALQKAKIIKAKDRDGGECVILDIHFNDPAVTGFVPYRLPKKDTPGVESGGGGGGKTVAQGSLSADPSIGQHLKKINLLRPKDALAPIFEASETSTGVLYLPAELRPIITHYIESEGLVSDTNKRLVNLNPILANAVFNGQSSLDREVIAKGSVPRDALIERIQQNCSHFHVILRNDETRESVKAKSGTGPKILIILETRSGNKTVTKVSGIEPFHVNPQLLADELQKACASSTSVGQLTGSSPKHPVMEILVQGPQKDIVMKALERRGVSRGWIDVTDKSKGKKVTYSDSHSVYSSIADPLHARLPLRNLNWNSDSHPFRSIPSLHVELVRDAASTKPLKEVEGDWSIKSEESKEEDARQARRHQIPGLRQSPYLKIYFLKCDDVDTYRATSRKDVREWISSHTPESQKSSTTTKKDNHDAFEWLIVQVVDKPTDRSGTPELSSDSKKESASKRFSTLSRMSSRGSSTSVIEKVRSDFNGTSKHAVDRVVQLVQDGDKLGFDDLVAKMKALILASFDLRVAQYEDDIREKELQRSLPGWNFNTFFVLKEGLARGFEAVGLLEDALTGYHELATGLNAIVKDQNVGDGENKAAAPFNEYTNELQTVYAESLNGGDEPSGTLSLDFCPGSAILDTSRKDFRHLILANDISVFDFQCYVFARQTNLLLRLANAENKRPAVSNGHAEAGVAVNSGLAKPSDDEPENLLVLAETCQLASEFIALTAGSMREDISKSAEKLTDGEGTDKLAYLHNCVIDNLISSWTSSVAESILDATSSQTLSTQIRPLMGQLLPAKIHGSDPSQPINIVSRRHERLPDRTSSLTGASKPKTPIQESFSSISTPDGLRLLPPGTPHPGAQELAAQRGSLFSLHRRTLNNMSYRIKRWHGGLIDTDAEVENDRMQDVDLEDEDSTEYTDETRLGHSSGFQEPTSQGIRNQTLSSALGSKDNFYKAYEELTVMALAHYVVGTRTNAAEGMTADLAIIRWKLQDYRSAASYFDQLSNFYGKTFWTPLEVSMLDMHAQCLKLMGRIEDYTNVALKAIGARNKGHETSSSTSCSLAEIIRTSDAFLQPVTVPLEDHFDSVELDPYLRHYSNHDGFQMLLELRSLFTESFRADTVRVKITSADSDRTGDHWLSVDGREDIPPGMVSMLVGTREMHPGWYKLVGINIQARNIVFVHDSSTAPDASFFSAGQDAGLHGKADSSKRRFMIWARTQHLNVRSMRFEAIDLRRPKSLKVEISSGWNRIQSGTLSIKAGSAGLRLDTSEAKALRPSGNGRATATVLSAKKYQPGTIDFGSFSEKESFAIQIPYSVENELNEIALKILVEYKTDAGNFSYASDCKLNITLPVSVNVQDIFRENFLLPKFTIGTATSNPLFLSSCHIEGNGNYEATSSTAIDQPVPIFARQPYSFVSRIRRKQASDGQNPRLSQVFQRLLHLQIEFYRLDEVVYSALEDSLSAALESSSFEEMTRLFHDALRSGARSRYVPSEYETVCLLEEIPKGTFEEYNWQNVLSGMSPRDGMILEKILREWHKDSPTLTLEAGWRKMSEMQYLTVPFDLPSTHIVHTVRLQPDDPGTATLQGLPSIAIDQPLSMRLDISHTRRWDDDLKLDSQAEALEFSYELHASPDTWLIGGQRKAKFSSKEGEKHAFAVLLVPQSTGRLLYPSVEITPISKASRTAQESGEHSPLSSETDYLSQSETVLVVPNLASTTVSLDPANGGWLVESRSR